MFTDEISMALCRKHNPEDESASQGNPCSHLLYYNIDFEFGSIQRPLCIIMAPAGNTDARYSTSNKSQRDMYVVNININIQGRPSKSNVYSTRLPSAEGLK